MPTPSLAPRAITPTDLQRRLDTRTKPQGSLGRLETLAIRIGLTLQSERPRFTQPRIMVFAGDHGIAPAGVSAFPQEVTAQMVMNYLSGGAAINVLAKQFGLALAVIDAGVASPLAPTPGLINRNLGRGTRNYLHEAAMTPAQRDAAVASGRELAASAIADGSNALLLGEMGIGNTASAAMMLHRVTGWALEDCVGRGTGLDDAGLSRKVELLKRASARVPGAMTSGFTDAAAAQLADATGDSSATAPPAPSAAAAAAHLANATTAGLHAASARAPSPSLALETLGEFGGFELAMIVGAILEAANHRCLVVLDGFAVSVAALIASLIDARALDHCVFSHCSAEKAHRALLRRFDAQPLLDLELRLGEASGAALAWPLIDSAARLLSDMASFESAGVSDRA